MQLRSRRREEPEIIVIPLIDVLLMLLIFFMLATTFGQATRIKVQLPVASDAPQEERKDDPVQITIDAQGRYYVNQMELVNDDFAILKRELEKQVEGRSKMPPVVITADAKTPHQAVMTAMDAASQVGLTNMVFSAKQREAP